MNLTITSPLMRGQDVTNVQTALKEKNYLQGKVDGVYGPDTARAVHNAKYWLGYALKNVDYHAGDMFYALITNKRQPNAAMRARIWARRRQAGAVPLREKMLREATKWLGTKESPPGSNKVKFSEWYGITGPWCAMFVTWCGVQVGSKAFARSSQYAYVPFMVNDAYAGRNGLSIVYKPSKGDLVAFDWNHDKISDHIGFFDRWITQGIEFESVEGNTGIGNDSNGGQVMVRQRKINDVQCFIHVDI